MASCFVVSFGGVFLPMLSLEGHVFLRLWCHSCRQQVDGFYFLIYLFIFLDLVIKSSPWKGEAITIWKVISERWTFFATLYCGVLLLFEISMVFFILEMSTLFSFYRLIFMLMFPAAQSMAFYIFFAFHLLLRTHFRLFVLLIFFSLSFVQCSMLAVMFV